MQLIPVWTGINVAVHIEFAFLSDLLHSEAGDKEHRVPDVDCWWLGKFSHAHARTHGHAHTDTRTRTRPTRQRCVDRKEPQGIEYLEAAMRQELEKRPEKSSVGRKRL